MVLNEEERLEYEVYVDEIHVSELNILDVLRTSQVKTE